MTTPASVSVDPITVEVIGSSFASIAEEMGEALVKASYSTNIKERRDCSTALFDVEGQTLCQAEHIPMHLGSFIGIIPHILKRHSVADMKPGDVFIGNDAYEGGGTHLPDIVLAEPVFHEGVMIAWAVNTAHHSDFADRGHAHIYQEGLRIPPIRLYDGGVLMKDVQELILLNCQVPRERLSDLRAQMAANRLGVERLRALCDKYGRDTVLAAGRALQDYAERKMRAGIASIPDGTYRFSDSFDNPEIDEPLTFSVAITVDGEEMRLAFDSPPQMRAGFNMVYTALLSTVYYAVKTVADPTIPPNAGLARPLTVTATEGTVLNCVHPAAVNGRIAACQRVVDLIHGALAQAVPDRVIAACSGAVASATFAGEQPGSGELWVYLETIGGGSGARANKDGLHGVHVHMTNTSNLPAEALENEYALLVDEYALVEDSGGAGRHRGGLGIARQISATRDGIVFSARSDGHRAGAPGLFGGLDGRTARLVRDHGTEQADELSSKISNLVLQAGQSVRLETPGGGGFGLPAERELASLAQDIRSGKSSRAQAERDYGPEMVTRALNLQG